MKLSPFIWVAVGLVAGWGAAVVRHTHSTPASTESQRTLLACPMHPWITATHPGKCTVCEMDLAPVRQGNDMHVNAVILSPGSVRVSGVQTAVVKRAALTRSRRFAGRFEEDMTTHAIISAPVEGRIDGLGLVHGTGKITQRQPLANIFSRTLLDAAKEYKDALNHDEAAAAAARQRLERHGLVWEQIKAIPQRQDNDLYFGILSPRTGSVVKSYVNEGQYVREGDKLFEITNLSRIWFVFAVFSQDLPGLEVDQNIALETADVPPQKVFGRLAELGRQVDEVTHATQVRLDVDVPAGSLRLNSDGVALVSWKSPDVLLVPRAGVLWPGAGPRVYVEKEPGLYEPRQLQLGRVGDADWEVISGVNEGEHVVTNAAILIDGQAQLNAVAQ